MLAQNFKTPSELGISDAEFDALYKVLGMLERGELVHHQYRSSSEKRELIKGFNMAGWPCPGTKDECGTVGCIGGWAEVIGQLHFTPNSFKRLHPLFYPKPRSTSLYGNITPAQAAIALRSYLTSGDPCWDEALSH